MDCDPERIWKIIESNRQNILPNCGQPPFKLFDKLHDSFVEHTSDKSERGQPFRNAVNLLSKVDVTTSSPFLLVNIYDDDKGYSVLLRLENDISEEIYLPYGEDYIFQYLDNEQVPPVVLDILLKKESCIDPIVCEVRNHRDHKNGLPDVHLLLLRPTFEEFSLAVHELAQQCNCSGEEEVFLESRLLAAAQAPICLDPSTDVACVNNRLCYNQLKFNCNSVQQYLNRRSHSSRNRLSNVTRTVTGLQGRHSTHRKFTETWRKSRKVLHNPNIAEALQEITKLSQMRLSRLSRNIKISIEEAMTCPDNIEEIPSHSETITTNPCHTPKTPIQTTFSPLNMEDHVFTTPRSQKSELVSSRSPPPLNIWHPSNYSTKNRLPKLHPLMNKKTDRSFVKQIKNTAPTSTMPQLHRMPSSFN